MDEKIKASEDQIDEKFKSSGSSVDDKLNELEKLVNEDGKKVQILEANGIKSGEQLEKIEEKISQHEKNLEETNDKLKAFTTTSDFQNEIKKIDDQITSIKEESAKMEERIKQEISV